MSLKKRLILLLLIAGSILALSFLASFNIFMVPSLKKNRMMFIETLKKKFKIALSIEEQNIAVLCDEWANRECIATYMVERTQEIVTGTFPDALFSSDRLDLLLILDIDKKVLFSKGYLPQGQPIDFSHLDMDHEIARVAGIIGRPGQRVKSIVKTPCGPLVTVANPTWSPANPAEPVGIMLVAQFIDREMAKRLSTYTMEKIEVLALDDDRLDAFYREQMRGDDFHSGEKRGTLSTFYLLKDIDGRPAVILHGTSDNKLFRVVNRHTIAFVAMTIFATIFLGLMLFLFIDRSMIRRICSISDAMKQIEGLADLSIRIKKDGRKDEISQLIANVNLTLDKLENEKVNREKAEKTMITHGKLVSIGRLSSNIAHEINNPLLAISNSIQVIKKNLKEKSKLTKTAIDISESEIKRIRDIISGLLDFHRLDQEEFSDVNIKEVLQHSLDLLKWNNKLGATRVIRDIKKECFVYGSPIKLKQVFINLILNAVEAMEGMKRRSILRIEVRTAAEDEDVVEIHFIDNGPGIPAEIKGCFFEPLISTKKNRGVGLGLYISFEIISNHQGEIIHNEDHSPGAHFIIKLPVRKRCTDG